MDRCVRALLADPQLGEVIICIDGPDPASARVADVLAEQDARVVRLMPPQHQGRMQARQNGAEAATGEVLLLVDDDVIATSPLASLHAAAHREQEGLVVVGYMGLSGAQTVFEQLYAHEYDATFAKLAGATEPLDGLWGGNVSLRRADALRVGLISPGFEDCYFEDKDFGLRCKVAGLHGVVLPGATADHIHRRDTARFVEEAMAMGRGMRLLHERHPELGALSARHFVETAPRPARPLVALLSHLSPSFNGRLASVTGVVPAVQRPTARIVRRALQHRGAQ